MTDNPAILTDLALFPPIDTSFQYIPVIKEMRRGLLANTNRSYRLDLGCGRNPRAGYTGVDLHEDADIHAPIWAVPLPDDSAEALYSSHALEHVTKVQVLPTLREWRRLLRPGGELILRVPDLGWCVRNWIATGMGNGWELDTIFGSQEHEGLIHRTGFTRPMLEFYLGRAGFRVRDLRTIESHGQPTIEAVCL